jgi:uncharacterized protein (TIGR01777 family)
MSTPKNILITGGTGLIGARLTELLLQNGYSVAHLGRTGKSSSVPSFRWDIENRFLDEKAFHNVDTVIHLAGAGVAEKRWTRNRKREILESRTKSTRLLFDTLAKIQHSVNTLISISAIGYYGFDKGDVFIEESPAGNDFLANVTRQWEEEADRITGLKIRVVKLRTGVVLSAKGGALKELAAPVKYFVGVPLGTGNQIISWIHIDDLCGIFIKALTDKSIQGVYNAVAPNPVTNREMTKAIGAILNKPVFLPAVPAPVLKLMLGEMAEIVLNGSRVSPKKIQRDGYIFKFTSLKLTLHDLLG